ncbi:pulmonary surfactant-associated protein B isoform X2 [Prinia subflava]|uniref:pulmonary surfactant-associated protein B isoform X2 n=1 Tax=Prinia subflava TaxID=208062 RepID=UPI002FE0B45D
MAQLLFLLSAMSPTVALALQLLLVLLGTTPGLGAPGGGCGMPPSVWCQDWVTALRCGALGRCPHLTQGHPDVDVCAVCQQLVSFFHQVSNQSATEKPWQLCATLNLCRGEPGAAPAAPALEAPGTHLQGVPVPQGSGGAALSPEALPLPLPLCWLCRTLVARAEAAVPVGSVAAAVAGLCRALPLPVAGACQCLAERYAALALEGLLGRLGPRLLCRLLLACRSGDNWDNEDVGTVPPPWVLEAIVVRLAECVSDEDSKGGHVPVLSLPLGPCALGPIFWCSGPKAAQRCQALQHCQEHVWL